MTYLKLPQLVRSELGSESRQCGTRTLSPVHGTASGTSSLVCLSPHGGGDGPSLSSVWPFSLPVSRFSGASTWGQTLLTVLSMQKETVQGPGAAQSSGEKIIR